MIILDGYKMKERDKSAVGLQSSPDLTQNFEAQDGTHETVLDQATLDRIRAMQRPGAPNFLAKIIDVFLESSDSLMRQLGAAIELHQDTESVSQVAHCLKSGSANVGAMVLSDLCRTLEDAGRDKDINRASEVFESVELEYGKVCEALNLELQNANKNLG